MDLVKIEGDEIVIRIKIDTIPIAFHCLFGEFESEEEKFTIINNEIFAKDIVYELNKEEENGDTLIYHVLDTAMQEALNQGSLGIDVI